MKRNILKYEAESDNLVLVPMKIANYLIHK